MDYFEEGDLDKFNPGLGVNEQADLLPFDKKFEFPREKLTIGKRLGAGAFGVVYEGLATGIVSSEEKSVVAVKMVKKTADNEVRLTIQYYNENPVYNNNQLFTFRIGNSSVGVWTENHDPSR